MDSPSGNSVNSELLERVLALRHVTHAGDSRVDLTRARVVDRKGGVLVEAIDLRTVQSPPVLRVSQELGESTGRLKGITGFQFHGS